MNTSFVTSPDGTRIAYDVIGEGSAIILLHGGWQTRQKWHEVGYVQRLRNNFKVVAMDIRGNGESDTPTDSTYYTTEKMCQDILAVADACGIEKFTIWGFSYGANIGRYLAAQSDRVKKLILMGIPFGLGAPGDFRRLIEEFRDHWSPILQAKNDRTLNITSLSMEDQKAWQKTNIAVEVAWQSAILDWGVIEPADLRCQTLWLVGSRNETTMASIQEYEEKLKRSMVRVEVIEGLNHREEFTEIDRSLPVMLAFMSNAV
ncbi:MAG TPA: alpha/beta hydrolase [Candidatus Saccharimonadales bacterium]|nr:alpha/beta hydrolase [Candidatus Saccharimonadales bacterium]